VTVNPWDGAGPFSETVPVEAFPPINEVGLTIKTLIVNGLMVRVAAVDFPERVAVIFADTCLETWVVGIPNVALVAPEGTVTLLGTDAAD
jgi:hypothetical protein